MRIELDYNPYFPLTTLLVDKELRNSKYSELYPVHNFPLQGWLYRNGAWPGLLETLENLSRGRETEVVFTGREVDYADFAHALQPANYRLSHRPAYSCETLLRKMEALWARCDFLSTLPDAALLEEYRGAQSETQPPVKLELSSPEEFENSRTLLTRSHLPFICMDAVLFQSLRSRLRQILFENLRRPNECILLHGEIAEEDADGCTILRGPEEEKRLFEKYVLPDSVRICIRKLERIRRLFSRIHLWAEASHSSNAQIKSKLNLNGEQAEQDALYEQYDENAAALEWYRRQKTALTTLENAVTEVLKEVNANVSLAE